jgi:hypothetical protein
MELFLNIFWLLIALGGLGVWCTDRAFHKRRTPNVLLQEWAALTCALVFIFFAVSLSDDLHVVATLSDDPATSRHHSLVWDCGHSSHSNVDRAQQCSAATVPGPLFPANLHPAGQIVPAPAHLDRYLKESSLFGRSPPPSFNL